MMASVLGLLSKLPSARGGWWDTGSYEGLMWIHQRERVLSAPEAEASRRGGVGGVSLNVNAAYVDAEGFGRALRDPRSDLSGAVRKLNRRGGRP
jgi:hypothetical protein